MQIKIMTLFNYLIILFNERLLILKQFNSLLKNDSIKKNKISTRKIYLVFYKILIRAFIKQDSLILFSFKYL
jgi:hypothetical protein